MSTAVKAARDLTPSPSTIWKDELNSMQQNSAQGLSDAPRWRPTDTILPTIARLTATIF
jgi:hypothetical protein